MVLVDVGGQISLLFADKFFRFSKEEIHLKILQPTPCEPMSFAEVVKKVVTFLGLIAASGSFIDPPTAKK